MRNLMIILGISLAFGGVYFAYPDSEPSENQQAKSIRSTANPVAKQDTVDPADEQSLKLDATRAMAEALEQREVDEASLQAHQLELENLIEEYDQHLHDPEKRAEIERRVDAIAETYKQEVLAKVKSLQ